ncbi:MAG: segregation/condensation protein A [Sphingomonadales bacterium]|nr:segregation/condensation protein A [Sphingomonadales bacterium]
MHDDPDILTIDVDGWEGPLDLLLTLARNQKVDLREISILELVQQYLHFIENARSLKLELAADYLVMAAWLTYLKSGLLLPKDPAIDPSPEELALRLQLRLERLNAMRESGARLMARDRIGRDVFLRGKAEGLRVVKARRWQCHYFDLITAYGQVNARTQPVFHVVKKRAVMTLEEALERVSAMIGHAVEWTAIEAFLPVGATPALRKSALASSFLAALELAKQGALEIEQDGNFAPLMLRRRISGAAGSAAR